MADRRLVRGPLFAALFAVAVVVPVRAADVFDWPPAHREAETIAWQDLTPAQQSTNQPVRALYITALRALTSPAALTAEVYFRAILARAPEAYYAQWGLGEVLRRKHDAATAKALLDDVIKHHPDFLPARVTRAYLQYLDRDFLGTLATSEAVLDRGAAAMDQATYVRALVMAAGACGMLADTGGMFAKMKYGLRIKPLLEQARKLRPDMLEVLIGYGAFYLMAPRIIGGDRDKALAFLLRAAELYPYISIVHIRLVQAYEARGEKEKAAQHLAEAVRLDPKNPFIIDLAGDRKFTFVAPEEK